MGEQRHYRTDVALPVFRLWYESGTHAVRPRYFQPIEDIRARSKGQGRQPETSCSQVVDDVTDSEETSATKCDTNLKNAPLPCQEIRNGIAEVVAQHKTGVCLCDVDEWVGEGCRGGPG